MANYERGVYRPPGDDVHVFDGGEDDEDVEGSRLPFLIVIALFVLAAFAGVVWLAYTQGVARGHNDVPRIIAAQPGPAKVAATAEQSGGAIPYKGLKVYEQPAPADEEADQAPAPANTNEKALPPADIVAAPKPDDTKSIETKSVEAKPVAAKPVEAKPVETAPAKKASVDKSVASLLAETKSAPAATPPVKVASVKAKATVTPPPQAAEAPATAAPAQLGVKHAGAFVLQIGAYKSEEDANAAWSTYHSKHAGLLSGYGPDVKKVDLGDKGIWYRLRAGSFADKDAAKALCDRLTAEGGACFPAK